MGKKLSQIEKEYGVDFGVSSDMELSAYLNKQGFPSLAKCLMKLEKKTKPPKARPRKMKETKGWAIICSDETVYKVVLTASEAHWIHKIHGKNHRVVPVLISELPRSARKK